jgi:hypothetical protein
MKPLVPIVFAAMAAAGLSAVIAGCAARSHRSAKPIPKVTPVPAAPSGTTNGIPPPGTANANTPYGRGL